MRDKISFLILTHQGSASRQIVTSKKMVKTLFSVVAGIIIVGLIGAGYMIYDYHRVKTALAEKELMETLIVSQQEEIIDQREEIQKFAEKISALNADLATLKEYEAKVRKINDIEQPTSKQKDNVTKGATPEGVGGPSPDESDAGEAIKDHQGRLINVMHEQIDQLKLSSIQQSDGIKDLLERLIKKRRRSAHTPSIRPVKGRTTSRYGYRRSAFTKKREFHKGHDIGAPIGTPIVATADGTVKFAGRDGSFGKMIAINHGYGYVTRYAHATKILKKRGEQVKKGEVIALVGNTGRSTGPHVHYEVLKKGVAVNPKKYFTN